MSQKIKEEYIKWLNSQCENGRGGITMEEQADWWLSKFNSILEEIINDLESNPNEDGSISPSIMHWIERKQIQLRKNYKDKLK